MSAISRTVNPEYRPTGGASFVRSTWSRVRLALNGAWWMRRHRDDSQGKITRRTSGTRASQPNAAINMAPRIGNRLPRCTL
jgi:hypothetical protein